MIAVIFEVEPKDKYKQNYLDMAGELKPLLEAVDGFISVERFQSLTNEHKILSLSFFRDETALKEWRNIEAHRRAQDKGRNVFFADYRLRIAGVIRDYGLHQRAQAPNDSQAHHATHRPST